MIGDRQRVYLEAMGIDIWVPRHGTYAACEAVSSQGQQAAVSVSVQSNEGGSEDDKVASLDWQALQAQVSQCSLCELHDTRTQTVFGVGHHQAQLLIIGEAPGADEDRLGEPFVGRAGQLLDAMLKAIGLAREQVYITNILKCRPPRNRDPKPEEANLCSPYLNRQIQLIQPKLILALGRIAAHRLLQTDSSLSRLRGKLHTHGDTGTDVIVTYHPAYLLRTPQEKRKAWADLLFVKQQIIP